MSIVAASLALAVAPAMAAATPIEATPGERVRLRRSVVMPARKPPRSRWAQAKPKRRRNMLHVSKRVRRKHRRAGK